MKERGEYLTKLEEEYPELRQLMGKKKFRKSAEKHVEMLSEMEYIDGYISKLHKMVMLILVLSINIVALVAAVNQGFKIKTITNNDYEKALDLAEKSYFDSKQYFNSNMDTEKISNELYKVTIDRKGYILFDFSKDLYEIKIRQDTLGKTVLDYLGYGNIFTAFVLYILNEIWKLVVWQQIKDYVRYGQFDEKQEDMDYKQLKELANKFAYDLEGEIREDWFV